MLRIQSRSNLDALIVEDHYPSTFFSPQREEHTPLPSQSLLPFAKLDVLKITNPMQELYNYRSLGVYGLESCV